MAKQDVGPPVEGPVSNFKFHVEEAILIVLIILSVSGVSLTNFSSTDGWWYWMAMIFVFAIAAMVTGAIEAKKGTHFVKHLLATQTIHWLGAMATMVAAFSFLHAEVMDEQATGLVILLILALATFLDGMRIGWRFSMIGVFLGMTAVIIAYIKDFLLIIVGLAIVIIGITIYWGKNKRMKQSVAN